MCYRIMTGLFVLVFFVLGCDEEHCMSGDRTRCDDDVIQQCDGYMWVDIEDCTESDFGPLCSQLEGGDAYCTDGTY